MTTETKVLPLERWKDFYRKLPYGVIKNGFLVDPEDPLHLIPDPEQIFWLEKGFDYIEGGSSYREVGDWLVQKLKKQITHATVSNLYKTYRKPYVNYKTNRRKGVAHDRDTRKIIATKVKARAAAKKADKLFQEAELSKKKLQPHDFPEGRPEKKAVEVSVFKDSQNKTTLDIIFKPNPGPQEDFLQSTESQILFGGAAGGKLKSEFPAPFSQ